MHVCGGSASSSWFGVFEMGVFDRGKELWLEFAFRVVGEFVAENSGDVETTRVLLQIDPVTYLCFSNSLWMVLLRRGKRVR